jgi:hypothetical protein
MNAEVDGTGEEAAGMDRFAGAEVLRYSKFFIRNSIFVFSSPRSGGFRMPSALRVESSLRVDFIPAGFVQG